MHERKWRICYIPLNQYASINLQSLNQLIMYEKWIFSITSIFPIFFIFFSRWKIFVDDWQKKKHHLPFWEDRYNIGLLKPFFRIQWLLTLYLSGTKTPKLLFPRGQTMQMILAWMRPQRGEMQKMVIREVEGRQKMKMNYTDKFVPFSCLVEKRYSFIFLQNFQMS